MRIRLLVIGRRKLSQTILLPPNAVGDLFGHSVSLSADGKLLALGVPGNMVCGSSSDKEGHAKVYEWDESSMSYEQVHIIYAQVRGTILKFSKIPNV